MVKSRVERLMSNVDDMDAVVILNDGEPFLDSTFWYITEQNSGCFEDCIAIVKKDGSMDVIVNVLEEESAHNGKGNVCIYHDRKERDEFIKNALKGTKKVGFNIHNSTYAGVAYIKKVVEDIEITDATKAIGETVCVKDAKEIEATEKACNISSKVASEIPEMLHDGISEKEMASQMDNKMRLLGGTGNAFDTIAAFGANSSQPHHMPCDYRIKKGDTALFDFGTKYDRYCSDMTRTVFFGEPPDIMKRAYEVVLEAQTLGLEEYRDGANASAADLVARKLIDSTEFKGKFIHSFGHGIGMDVHQVISISSKSPQILHEGNIVSAEPGIYLPGIGGVRIEDTILITKNGYKRLTSYDHKFTVV